MAQKSPIPLMSWAAAHQWEFRFKTLAIIAIAMSIMSVGEGLLVQAKLGSTPWTVLSQGISLRLGISIGFAIGLVSLAVLLLCIPFKLRFGLGTILNILLIALFADLTVRFVSAPESFALRIAYMLLAILIFSVGTAFYLSCRLGAGPRDGLMVGICARYGWNVGRVRTSLEILACVFGFLLGGTFGISTIVFALSVGWIIQFTFSFFHKYEQAV